MSQVVYAVFVQRLSRFLLREDGKAIVTAASQSMIGCGIGFELALLLPPVLLWYRRARRRA